MKRFFLSELADADIAEIVAHVGLGSLDRAHAISEEFLSTFEMIARFPRMGRLRPEWPRKGGRVRSVVAGRWVVLYRTRRDAVEIARVLSGHRDIGGLLTR